MTKQGQLRLELLDVYAERLKEKVSISLRNNTLSDDKRVKNVTGSSRILIKDLFGAPNGLYRIEVESLSYHPVSRFVSIKASGITDLQLTFAVNSKMLKGVEFPSFGDLTQDLKRLLENSPAVLGFKEKRGEELYNALDHNRKAGLLNIAAKTQATRLSNGRVVLSYVESLKELRGDRFFAVVPKELREETKHSVVEELFRPVNELLHHPPEEGFSNAGSFKTQDHYGNLQLSFFIRGEECVADIDIDDAAGLEHVFQVLRNHLKDRPTQPYDIHEILLAYQKIDPGYRFLV